MYACLALTRALRDLVEPLRYLACFLFGCMGQVENQKGPVPVRMQFLATHLLSKWNWTLLTLHIEEITAQLLDGLMSHTLICLKVLMLLWLASYIHGLCKDQTKLTLYMLCTPSLSSLHLHLGLRHSKWLFGEDKRAVGDWFGLPIKDELGVQLGQGGCKEQWQSAWAMWLWYW